MGTKVSKTRIKGKARRKIKAVSKAKALQDEFEGQHGPIDGRHELLSLLLPATVKEFYRQMEAEVEELCGSRFKQGGEHHRWGSQPGSIVLGGQKVAVEKVRVRKRDGAEQRVAIYDEFQDPKKFEERILAEGLRKVSQRDYVNGIEQIGASFGFSKSSVSRQWKRASEKKLKELQERDLSGVDARAVFIDGKRFRKYGVVLALGVARCGRKALLGIYQCSSESSDSCLNMLSDLERRGLATRELLFIVDGGSGLNKALNDKYFCNDHKKRLAVRIRCMFHKWQNLRKILGDDAEKVSHLFWAIRDAQGIKEAKEICESLEVQLKALNLSALNSWFEAKPDIMVLHELGLSRSLRRFFATTNPIESLNSLLEEDMRRVKRWKDSAHFQRWLATMVLGAEKRMRRPRGCLGLAALWVKLRTLTTHENIDNVARKRA